MEKQGFTVRPLRTSDHDWVVDVVRTWGADFIVSRGRKIFAAELPGFCAVDHDGRPIGLATYEIMGGDCQLVMLDALGPRQGVGTVLVQAVREAATAAGCRRLWLITSNDNLDAMRFYQRRDFELVAVHRDFLRTARRLKPSIPVVGEYGIVIRDEVEFETRLCNEDGTPAVVFDMDGVILDSDSTWEAVMSELFALGGKSLKDLDPDAFLGGDNSLQWAAFLRNLLGLSMTDDEIVQWVVERIVSRYEGRLPLISGAVEAVARLAATYPLGLASSSPRGVIETVLRRSGLDRLFQVWVSSDDVDCGKPAPDVFLLCAGLLGMAPERCVAVEDSRVGIKAAHTAGFRVIAVPNPVFPLDAETRALADVVVGSIAELDSELVESLVGKV